MTRPNVIPASDCRCVKLRPKRGTGHSSPSSSGLPRGSVDTSTASIRAGLRASRDGRVKPDHDGGKRILPRRDVVSMPTQFDRALPTVSVRHLVCCTNPGIPLMQHRRPWRHLP